MASLLELSHELLHCVLVEIDPADLAAVSKTCQTLYCYIRANRLLHKDVYLRRYDEPSSIIEPSWEEEIHRAVKLEKILHSEDRKAKLDHLAFASEQIGSMLKTANTDSEASANVQLLTEYFEDVNNIDTLLCSSSLFASAGTLSQLAAATPELRQASAKLHCLFGKPIEPVPTKRCSTTFAVAPFFSIRHMRDDSSPAQNTRLQLRGTPAHMVARSKVYDLREYTDDTLWGPFMNDGSQNVDWEKIEAVMVVLGFNLNKFSDRSGGRFPQLWNTPFQGAAPHSYASPPPHQGPTKEMDSEFSIIRDLVPSIDSLDPYGVTGTWMRIVCFLDYNDLYAFNFSHGRTSSDHDQVTGPMQPIDTEEGIIDLEEFVRSPYLHCDFCL